MYGIEFADVQASPALGTGILVDDMYLLFFSRYRLGGTALAADHAPRTRVGDGVRNKLLANASYAPARMDVSRVFISKIAQGREHRLRGADANLTGGTELHELGDSFKFDKIRALSCAATNVV